jgi:hypothetical protein
MNLTNIDRLSMNHIIRPDSFFYSRYKMLINPIVNESYYFSCLIADLSWQFFNSVEKNVDGEVKMQLMNQVKWSIMDSASFPRRTAIRNFVRDQYESR